MCLILGPSGVGKTLLIKRLTSSESWQVEDLPTTIPTIGTNLEKFYVNKKQTVSLRELGGSMAPIWHNYYFNLSAVMYVIDMASQYQIASTTILLLDLLSQEKLQFASILIILNRRESPSLMNMCDIRQVIRLNDIVKYAHQRITLLEVSFATGQGLDEVIQWIKSNT